MKHKIIFKFILLAAIFIVALSFSLFFRTDPNYHHIILNHIRIPAAIKAIVAGSLLSLGGMFMQSISKNPLADPYLTGLSSGAGLFIVISILLFNGINYSLFGFLGALTSAVLIIAVCGFSKFSVTKLILTGLSVNLFVGSLISFLILTNPDKAYVMTLVLTGGLNSGDISNKLLLTSFVLILLLSGLFIPKLNAFRLDRRLVFKTKKEINVYSIIFIILSAILTSLSVYCAGILGFLGIICPLFCKMLFGEDTRLLFPANILCGSSLLLISNILANNLIYPLVIPLGIVVAICGAPVFIYFLLKKGGILGN